MTIERMSGADAAWLHMDRPENLMIVNTVLSLETTPDWNVVLDLLQERFIERHERFRQRAVDPLITLGLVGPVWSSVPTRARDHFVHVALPAPGDEHTLHSYVAAQARLPLDARRPPWEVHAIDGLGAGAALLLRTHHAMGDGRAMVEVIAGLTDPCSGRRAPDEPHPQRRRPADDPRDSAAAWVGAALKLGGRMMRWPDLDRPRLTGRKTMAWVPPIPLQRLKQAAAPRGSSVNDLVLAAVAGALRSLTPAGPCRDLEVIVPIDLRPPGPVDGELGNRFGLAFVRLPVACPDPDERLKQVTLRMRPIKRSREGDLVFAGLGLAGTVPRLAQAASTDLFIQDAAAVVTNVIGPRTPVALAGSRVTGMCFWVPSSGPVGIGISIISYAGDVVVAVVVDDGVVADAAGLAGAIEAELERLVGPRARTSRAATRTAPEARP
jgi:hypothetical protein